MPDLTAEEAQARVLGLALLDVNLVYERFFIPQRQGLLRQRPFPPHRGAIIGLVARQRRFRRATYTLADSGQVEALGALRSMFEFLVCQRWLANEPNRNWRLWSSGTMLPAMCRETACVSMRQRFTTQLAHRSRSLVEALSAWHPPQVTRALSEP